MSDQHIVAALQLRLQAFAQAKGLRVAYEGVPFTPGNEETFLADFLLPANTDNPSIGRGHRRYTGVYQVDVQYRGSNPVELRALANALASHFPRGLSLAHGGQVTLIIRDPSVGPLLPDGGRMKRPVSIQYQSDVIITNP